MPIEKTDGEEKLKRHQPCNQPKVTDRSNEIYFLDHPDGGEARDKQDERYKKRDGQRVVWGEADINCSTAAFPLETLKGKRLNSLAICFTPEQFHALEERFGHCPENIAVDVIAALSTI